MLNCSCSIQVSDISLTQANGGRGVQLMKARIITNHVSILQGLHTADQAILQALIITCFKNMKSWVERSQHIPEP